MGDRIYVVDSFDPYHKETGLVKTLTRLSSSGLFLPDDSILPTVSDSNRKLTNEQKAAVGATIEVVASALLSSFCFMTEPVASAFKEKAETEAEKLKPDNESGALRDWYLRFLDKLGRAKISLIPKGYEEVYNMFFSALKSADLNLDLRSEEECRTNKTLENLALGATLAVYSNGSAKLILARNGTYQDLFDATFGILYTQYASKQEIGNPIKVANKINNPKLRIASCDFDGANQPYRVVRDTEDARKLPKQWFSLKQEDQARIILELRRYFANISLLLSGRKLEEEPEIQTKQAAPVIRLIPKTEISTAAKVAKETVKPDSCVKERKEIEPQPTKLKLDDLVKIFSEIRVQPSNIPELYSSGNLKGKIEIYSAFRGIAKQVGAEKVIKLIDEDVKSIRSYLSERVSSLVKQLEVERQRVSSYLKSLDSFVDDSVNSQIQKTSEEPAVEQNTKVTVYDPKKAREIRESLHLSQTQLGKQLGMAQAQISKYELKNIDRDRLGKPGERYLAWLKSKGYNPFNLP